MTSDFRFPFFFQLSRLLLLMLKLTFSSLLARSAWGVLSLVRDKNSLPTICFLEQHAQVSQMQCNLVECLL